MSTDVARVATILLLVLGGATHAAGGVSWMWHPERDGHEMAPVGRRCFRGDVRIDGDAVSTPARFEVAVDNRCRVFVNGRAVGRAQGWKRVTSLDIRDALRPGRNVVAVEVVNEGDEPNPAGIAGRVVVGEGDGRCVFPIDGSWRSSAEPAEGWQTAGYDDVSWLKVEQVAAIGAPPWGEVAGFAASVPDSFPAFTVPGQEHYMELLRRLFYRHYRGAGPKATLWDPWLPLAALWPVGDRHGQFAAEWRAALSARRIDNEGYVSTHQHMGCAHPEGWPFPLWTQSGGRGWHFSLKGAAYKERFGIHAVKSVEDWELQGARSTKIDPERGWQLSLTKPGACVITPPMSVGEPVWPFVRLEWSSRDLGVGAEPRLGWATEKDGAFAQEREARFDGPDPNGKMTFAMIPMHTHPAFGGTLKRLAIRFGNSGPAEVTIRAVMTAVDSRHNINAQNFIMGCSDYVRWTGDTVFLREQFPRMRKTLAWTIRKFRVEEERCVYTTFYGHDGRSGFTRHPDGSKTIHNGRGIGNNYWDLLPCGGWDTWATIYLYAALLRMAELEEAARAHPEWGVPKVVGPRGRDLSDPEALRSLAVRMKERAGRFLWCGDTGRFCAAIDAVDRKSHDYGYTILNAEAIHYGFATESQARSVLDWMSGKRVVKGDTSTGPDIYHWRFGPRASTRRNIEWYSYVWQRPEDIPFGGQVQDGGAVLGFSYYDLMARLETYGPDDAWQRLREILDWFEEVQGEGGYRAYYARPGRGTLQGGGPPGGLGMDCEFFESVLVPQVMLYGFLGLRPAVDGFSLNPRLPRDWPSLRIDGIRFHGATLSIEARPGAVTVHVDEPTDDPACRVAFPEGQWTLTTGSRTETVAEDTRISLAEKGTAHRFEKQ
jgi:hypothetical protein